ncbi:MAG: hypothetical protein GY826_08915, partial [Fuerstiella sp.]|nr:hypothetical protein [Fuerstiella sp.]
MAQLINSPNEPLVTQDTYIAELEAHLAAFPKEASRSRALEWLQTILTTRDPLRAAHLALLRCGGGGTPDAKQNLLFQAGELMRKAAVINEPMMQKLLTLYAEQLDLMEDHSDLYPAAEIAPMRILALGFELRTLGTDSREWEALGQRLSEIRGQLTDRQSVRSTAAILQAQLLGAVISARTTTDLTRLDAIHAEMSGLASASLIEAIIFLGRQLDREVLVSGDAWLAGLIEELIQRVLRENGTLQPPLLL